MHYSVVRVDFRFAALPLGRRWLRSCERTVRSSLFADWLSSFGGIRRRLVGRLSVWPESAHWATHPPQFARVGARGRLRVGTHPVQPGPVGGVGVEMGCSAAAAAAVSPSAAPLRSASPVAY